MPSHEQVLDVNLSDAELARVLRRLGLGDRASTAEDLPPTKETLELVHRAVFTSLPFENLSVLTGEVVSEHIHDIVDKMCGAEAPGGASADALPIANRGGYCFELNKLLGVVLLRLGFQVEPKLGRVHLDQGVQTKPFRPPLTHQALLVTAPDAPEEVYLCDASFGRTALYEPLRLDAEGPVFNGFAQVELRRQAHATPMGGAFETRELWFEDNGEWIRGYSFMPAQDCRWLDFLGPNMSVYGHFDSIFTQMLWCEARTLETHALIFRNRFTLETQEGSEKVDITSGQQLCNILRQHYGMAVPLETCNRIHGIGAAEDVQEKWKRVLETRKAHRSSRVAAAT